MVILYHEKGQAFGHEGVVDMEEFTKSRMTLYAHLLSDMADVYLPQAQTEEGVYTSRADLLADRKMQKQRERFI